MKKLKRITLLGLILLLGIVISACGSTESGTSTNGTDESKGEGNGNGEEQGWPDRLVIGASSPGGALYVFGGIAGSVINQQLGISESIQDLGGGRANIQLLHEGDIHLGLASDTEATELYYDGGMTEISSILPIANYGFQLVVREDSDFETWSDLERAVVSVGTANSSNDAGARVMFEALGIEPKEIINGGHADNSSMFRDGLLDAMLVGSIAPVPAFAEVDTTQPLRLLPLSEEEMQTIEATSPMFSRTTIPGGSYRGTSEDVETLSHWAIIYASKSLPEDLVYEITKELYGAQQAFQDGEASAVVEPEYVTELAIPLHPGAYKYYEELGLDVPEDIQPN